MLKQLQRNHRLVHLFLIVLMGGMLSSCLPGARLQEEGQTSGNPYRLSDGDTGCEEVPPPSVRDQNRKEATSTIYEVYVDGSGSMLGYVKPPNSRYIALLDLLANRFDGPDSLNYFRIGYDKQSKTSVQALSASDFRLARKEEFYSGGGTTRFPAVSSQLVAAIEASSEGKVVVLISDLEEDEGYITKILSAIEEKVLKVGHAIAIVGIKSEFDGKIFFPKDPADNFAYNTTDLSVAAYRPFYLLVMGPSMSVRHFLGEFSSSLEKAKPDWFEVTDQSDAKQTIKTIETSLFDPNVLPALTFKDTAVMPERKKEIRQVISLRNQNSYLGFEQGSMNRALSILTTEPISQNYQLSLSSSSLVVSDSSKLENSILPQSFQVNSTEIKMFNPDSGKFDDPPQRAEVDLRLVDSPISWQAQEPLTVVFNLDLKPQTLIKDNIYLYQVRFRAQAQNHPEWWATWNLEQFSDRDGGKTYKLLDFLTGLHGRTLQYMETGELCYALQRKR